jgi:TetR/AcrR family transcriptional regulator, cholesterol catabolism regulator
VPPTATLKPNRTPGFDARLLSLLGAAARVFAADGYDRTSMRRIATEAGMSLAGVYHYCAGKQDLLYYIQFHAFDSLLRGLRECTANIADPRQRLTAAVRSHVRHFGENTDALKVCARELQALEGDAYRDVHDLRHAYFDAVHDIVKQLPPRTRSRRHSWLATANLFGMINGFYQWYDAGPARAGLDELADHQVALFLDGYAAPARKAGRERP